MDRLLGLESISESPYSRLVCAINLGQNIRNKSLSVILQDYAACEHWLGLAPALLDKVKEDETRELMKNRLDNMTIKTLYSQAKYEKAAEILEQCFGDSGGWCFMLDVNL